MVESIHGSLAVLGIGLAVLGAGYGVGTIGAAALHGIARQPEAYNKIQTVMLIMATLVEGVALFGIVMCVIFVKS